MYFPEWRFLYLVKISMNFVPSGTFEMPQLLPLTSIIYRSNTFTSDQYLIDTDLRSISNRHWSEGLAIWIASLWLLIISNMIFGPHDINQDVWLDFTRYLSLWNKILWNTVEDVKCYIWQKALQNKQRLYIIAHAPRITQGPPGIIFMGKLPKQISTLPNYLQEQGTVSHRCAAIYSLAVYKKILG